MRIAVIGAGAIGGLLAAHLAGSGEDILILARGPTLAAIRKDGLRLTEAGKTTALRIPASDNPKELGPQDLVIVAVKGPALAGVAPAIAALLGADSAVLPAMNGVPWWFTKGLGGSIADQPLRSVDPDRTISKCIPVSRAIGCVVHASASVAAPGHILHNTGNGLIIGEPDGSQTPRLARVADLLRGAGFDVTVSRRIQQDVWYKLWGNMTMNPISAMTGATADRVLDDALVEAFILDVMAEAKEVGRRIGCPIAESGEDRMKVTRKLGAFKTSMLQDFEAGRALEIGPILGVFPELGRRLEVPTPFCDAVLGLLRQRAANSGL